MQNAPDPYRTLGVVRGATEGQIKSAHRALAKRYHPDAPTGDTVRFLRVQEAYQLLSDPLRRREWDARHAPGPMRAGQAAPPRPRAPNGRWTRTETAPPGRAAGSRGGTPAGEATGAKGPAGGRPPRTPGRDPATRSYTWSASEVPWWEDHGPRDSRRQPGRRRPHEDQPPAAAPSDPSASPGTPDFDVYNRSSGAAWSSAARAYFRRAESDLPRRGSFHRQGTQPLTAARARVAAEEDARRGGIKPPSQSTPPGRNSARPATQPSGAGSPAADQAGTPAAHTGPPPRSSAAAPAAAARQAPGPAAPARPSTTAAGPPAHPRAGVAHDAQTISTARSAAREAARASRWPSVPERLLYALVAWLPVALLIGYAGSAVTGCDRAAVSCPAYFETLQTVLIALALGILVALPRVAYTAALATVAIIVTGIGVVIATWLVGLRQPLSGPVLAVASVLLLIAYLATAGWLLSDGRRGRPWATDRPTRRGMDR